MAEPTAHAKDLLGRFHLRPGRRDSGASINSAPGETQEGGEEVRYSDSSHAAAVGRIGIGVRAAFQRRRDARAGGAPAEAVREKLGCY